MQHDLQGPGEGDIVLDDQNAAAGIFGRLGFFRSRPNTPENPRPNVVPAP